jgi:hypothetical protein
MVVLPIGSYGNPRSVFHCGPVFHSPASISHLPLPWKKENHEAAAEKEDAGLSTGAWLEP